MSKLSLFIPCFAVLFRFRFVSAHTELDDVTSLRWNHGSGRALLCVGNKDGALALWDPVRNEAREIERGKFERESPVVDIQWYASRGTHETSNREFVH